MTLKHSPGLMVSQFVHACRFQYKYTLDELLSIRDVLGLPEASQKTFIETCTKALVFALVRFKCDSVLHEVAAILGEPQHLKVMCEVRCTSGVNICDVGTSMR